MRRAGADLKSVSPRTYLLYTLIAMLKTLRQMSTTHAEPVEHTSSRQAMAAPRCACCSGGRLAPSAPVRLPNLETESGRGEAMPGGAAS